ncbi:hypothetical protein PU683_07505 [Kosakonia cowanii]|uniref:hypothetical protein n=1 Tax=Kosakonia cowanii TaxID=208223 RepID=UPI0023FA0BB7|nr:hypothetical protein [Kosakonia cowanii]MDF7759374.1 hypothetical protein [Kosakonia cowanii]
MDNPLFLKVIVVVLLVAWVAQLFMKKRRTTPLSPAIAEANARERYQWRHIRRVFRLMQIASTLCLIVLACKVMLA